MARLHEFQGKTLLSENGIPVPQGKIALTPGEAAEIVSHMSGEVVLKAQAWVTGRAGLGGIRFVKTPADAKEAAAAILGMRYDGFPVEQLLVEQRLDIEREFYAGVIIDDTRRVPVVIFSSRGGTGIEEIAREHPGAVAKANVDILLGLRDYQARNLVRRTGIGGRLQLKIAQVLTKLYAIAKRYEARAVEINPLALLKNGELVAADCRITVDDYAVFRHPELEIEVAREFNRPPTELERIAYRVEMGDYRGTFYFIQLEEGFEKEEGFVGFHGAGGGGSMMSMDALLAQGFKMANFTDTSGNPPASKVYRAAKIILTQPNLDGYFASGSGVASQEQFHSARGLAKAFREEHLSIPAVIRLGGNQEEKAIEILRRFCGNLPATVEGYGKDHSADTCARRLRTLVNEGTIRSVPQLPRPEPPREPYCFETVTGGTVTIDHAKCRSCKSKVCIQECVAQILKLDDGRAVLSITPEEAKKGKCSECLACELECWDQGNQAVTIELSIPGLDEYKRAQKARLLKLPDSET